MNVSYQHQSDPNPLASATALLEQLREEAVDKLSSFPAVSTALYQVLEETATYYDALCEATRYELARHTASLPLRQECHDLLDALATMLAKVTAKFVDQLTERLLFSRASLAIHSDNSDESLVTAFHGVLDRLLSDFHQMLEQILPDFLLAHQAEASEALVS